MSNYGKILCFALSKDKTTLKPRDNPDKVSITLCQKNEI